MAEPGDGPLDDPAAFAALDAYLEALHGGLTADGGRLLAEHPQLAALLACINSLDQLAIPAGQCLAPETATLRPHIEPPAAQTTGDQPHVSRFGKFELLDELGRGGMGVVFKARQPELDRVVALKMILASNLASPSEVQRFQVEARAAAKLRHHNIVQIHEAGEHHGQQYFAMEYIEGPSLADLLAAGPVEFQDAARILAPIARAVDYLHRQGIVHRDVKPGNVLLSPETEVLSSESIQDGLGTQHSALSHCVPKLTDFGLAKMLGTSSDMTRTGMIVGTPSYMAPEQAAGRHKEVGPLADVFSLGAVLYHALTRRPPFRADTPLDTLVQVIEREPTPPRALNPAVPHELEVICLKCLEKTPERRYSSASALADDLECYLKGEEIAARPQGPVQRLWRWARTAPSLAAHLIALVVFAVLVHAVYLLAHHVELHLHLTVLGLLAAWGVASFLFHRGIQRERHPDGWRTAWAALDAAMLTAVLGLTDNAANPLVVFYALLIVGAGLWFRVALVWFTTFMAELGYAILMAWSAAGDADIPYPHHQVMFMLSLAVLGYMVAYQVKRVRALSQYYESRPLP